ncbi:MAG: hypothetical protein ACIAQZ_10795 [Sedimentisphaeraceae bacterium JB056]
MKLFTVLLCLFCSAAIFADNSECYRSVQSFNVLPSNTAAENSKNLQNAIDWASPKGAALFFEPSDMPYRIDGGLVLKANVSLVGVHGPVGRGTSHPDKKQPVGSVIAITDKENVFITVENATQIRGLQFWYPEQELDDPQKIIEYPATIQASKTKGSQGVTLSCLTFYGEFLAMDFCGSSKHIVEQILFEHCYGYPLSGEFIRVDYCYDIPRILHCHVNPANRRFIDGGYSKAVIDSVVNRGTFTYTIDHTDNAQLIDLFTFGAYGGIYLGPETYGQLTNFNLDCVTVGIHKLGGNDFNRCWQIAQGSIIANVGKRVEDIHPFIIEGKGGCAITNVESFSGHNGALTTIGKSQDYMLVKGSDRVMVTMVGCNMRNYVADKPIDNRNPNAEIKTVACFDKLGNDF